MGEISFWAKTTTDKESRKKLPSVSVDEHMLNVGSVALALSEAMPSLLSNFRLPNREVAALAALHDLGKISPGFQRKCKMWLKCNDLENEDMNRRGNALESSHSKITQMAVHKVLADMEIELAGYIAALLGAHHGRIQDDPETLNIGKINEMQKIKMYGVDWMAEWEKSTNKIIEYFGADLSRINLNENSPELWILAGLTTISDWIGSDENYFNANNNLPHDERIGLCKKILNEIGLEPLKIEKKLKFSQVFKSKNGIELIANDLQKNAGRIIKQKGVYVIEAPMGMGKTEAALWAAYNLLSSGKARGIYFALPTQATSNRMHLRMQSFVEKITPHSTPSRLIHGNSWLLTEGLWQPIIDDNPDEAKNTRDWFAGSKRALMAPFGVGTVDQAMKGVVAAKHFFVRHFALAGKVVIIDEVHSYDIYTGTLITKLVETLKNLGCIVIILSATLTEKRRNEFLKEAKVISPDSYPLITGFSKNEPTIPIECVCDKPKPKSIDICFKQELSAREMAIETAKAGGVVLWVCNTVQSSQEQYRGIRGCTRDKLPVGLLHARFPFWRRQELEDEWIPMLGKENKNRCGCILISTQIVEQSLDLDADLLITELAPTDILLQRLGRLWRHERENRHGRPLAIILEEMKSMAEFRAMDKNSIMQAFGPKAKIYCPYILLVSLEIWLQYNTILIPDQIRQLLELTYEEDRENPKAWEELRNDALGSDFCKKNLAIRNMNYWQIALSDEEERLTRLNDVPTASIILCKHISQNLDAIEFLNGEKFHFPIEKFDVLLARAIHKNLVRVPKNYFEDSNRTVECEKQLSDYLYDDCAFGVVGGDGGHVDIAGLKIGTSVQWNYDEGIIIKNESRGRT
jgi:CRISPR-associated endonuclease/helicase Cas3